MVLIAEGAPCSVSQLSGFLGGTTPVYEIRDFMGDASDLLVRSQKLGRTLAETLGPAAVALMRGHGSVVVGVSIKQVVYRAIYTENNARLQLQALPLGDITFLTPGEAQASADMNDEHLDRPWELWKRRVLAAGR
ncbi:HCOMODA/2-hydroxy-3-carboxy-muconic semialdehyde decarboxylase OS=Eoetvoesiella caeni OX=645616 GN=DFR37_106103 PE=4 SV=1 [Eoetvoesiella caeni]